MQRNLFSNYVFLKGRFEKYHYTDNRAGVPINYLAYMQKGCAKITSGETTIEIHPGDVFFIPKNLSYQSYWYGDDIDFLSCGFSSLNTVEDLNFELQIVLCDDKTKKLIENVFKNGGTIDCETLSYFYGAMAEILPVLKCKNESKETVLAEKIRTCIEEKPQVSLREIAKMCAISESYLYEVFKRVTRFTPNDYKRKVLCEQGIELLLNTDKKLEEISSLLNFSSSSYFRKVLKKYTGSTPNEIRKNRGF